MKAVILIPMALFACAANAETLFPMPSVPDVTDGDGWAFAIGAEIEYEAEYDGSDDYGVEAEPGFIIQKRNGDGMWFLEGQEIGWRGRMNDLWLVQGGIQSMSRALYARLIPAEHAGRLFGLYNMMGKFAAIFGPVLVRWVGFATDSSRIGILSILVLFIAGAALLARVDVERGEREAQKVNG